MSTLLAFIRADAARSIPIVPASWDVSGADNRWGVVYPLGRVVAPSSYFRARLMLRSSGNPQRALFVCTGPSLMLARLATAIAADGLPWTQTWATLTALRADGGATATAIKAAWPDERPRRNTGTLQSPVWTPTGTLVALWARMAGALTEDAET